MCGGGFGRDHVPNFPPPSSFSKAGQLFPSSSALPPYPPRPHYGITSNSPSKKNLIQSKLTNFLVLSGSSLPSATPSLDDCFRAARQTQNSGDQKKMHQIRVSYVSTIARETGCSILPLRGRKNRSQKQKEILNTRSATNA